MTCGFRWTLAQRVPPPNLSTKLFAQLERTIPQQHRTWQGPPGLVSLMNNGRLLCAARADLVPAFGVPKPSSMLETGDTFVLSWQKLASGPVGLWGRPGGGSCVQMM